ncbi:MAG: phosphatase PAP2 family protein, partial [Casimicrobiaceae bacterium]
MPADAERAIELAAAVGINALAVYAGTLVAILLGVAVGWRVARRGGRVPRQLRSRPATPRALVTTLLLGFAAILATALVVAALPALLAPDGHLARTDKALTAAIQGNVSQPVMQVFAAVTVLADTWVQWLFAIGGALVLLWRRERLLAVVWIAAIAGNGIVTRVVKTVFARARPLHDEALIRVDGYSFPSGHASGAIVIYGMLSYVLIRRSPVAWHLPIALAAAAVAFTVGCSRIFLQVHYASDVVAGFVTGLAWL